MLAARFQSSVDPGTRYNQRCLSAENQFSPHGIRASPRAPGPSREITTPFQVPEVGGRSASRTQSDKALLAGRKLLNLQQAAGAVQGLRRRRSCCLLADLLGGASRV